MSFTRFLQQNLAGGGPQAPVGNPIEDAARQMLIGSLGRAHPEAPPEALQQLRQMPNEMLVQLGQRQQQKSQQQPTLGRGLPGPQQQPKFRQTTGPIQGPVVPVNADQYRVPATPPPLSEVRPGGSGQLLPTGFFGENKDNATKTQQHALASSRLADATGGNPRDYQAMDEQTVAIMLANEIQKVFPQMSMQQITSGGIQQLLALSAEAARQGWEYAEPKGAIPKGTGTYEGSSMVRIPGGIEPESGGGLSIQQDDGSTLIFNRPYDHDLPTALQADPQGNHPALVDDPYGGQDQGRHYAPPNTITRRLTVEESEQVTENLKLLPEEYEKDAQAVYALELAINDPSIETREQYDAAVAEYEAAREAFWKKYEPYIGRPEDNPDFDFSAGGFIEAAKGVGGVAMDILDVPRAAQVTQAGELAYQYATTGELIDSESFSGELGDGINNFVQAGSSGLSSVLTAGGISADESFYGWMQDPANAKAIQRAYEQGIGDVYVDTDGDGVADAVGVQFTGGRAVWELYVQDKTGFERAALDISFDPTVWGTAVTGGLAKGGKAIAEGAIDEALVTGETAGTIARQGIGELMQVPNTIVTAGDRPLEAVVDWARSGPFQLSRSGQAATQSETIEDIVQEGILTGTGETGVPGSGAVGGAAPPLSGASGGPGPGPAPAGPSAVSPSPANAPVNPLTGLPNAPAPVPASVQPPPPQNYTPGSAVPGPASTTTQGPPPTMTNPPAAGPVNPVDNVPTQNAGGGRVHVGDASSEIYVRPVYDRTGAVSGYEVVRQTKTPNGATKYVPQSSGHATQADATQAAKQLVYDNSVKAVENASPAPGPTTSKLTASLDNIASQPAGSTTPTLDTPNPVDNIDYDGPMSAAEEEFSFGVPSKEDVPSSVVPVREDLPVQTRTQRNQGLKAGTQNVASANMTDRTLRDRIGVAAQQEPPEVQVPLKAELDAITTRTQVAADAIKQSGDYPSGQFYRKATDESLVSHQSVIDQAAAYQRITGKAAPRLDAESMLIRPGNATSQEGKLLDNIERAIYGTPDQVADAEKFITRTYIEGTGWKSAKDAATGKVTKTGPRAAKDPEFGTKLLDDVRRMRQEFEEIRGDVRPPDPEPFVETPNKVFTDPERIKTLTPASADLDKFQQVGEQAAAATKPAKPRKPKAPKTAQQVGKRTEVFSGGITSMPMGPAKLFQKADTGGKAIVSQADEMFQFGGKWIEDGNYKITNTDGRVIGWAKTEAGAAKEAKRLLLANENVGISPYGETILKAEARNRELGSQFVGDPVPVNANTLHPELEASVKRGNMDMDTALALNQKIEVEDIDPTTGKKVKTETTVFDFIIDENARGRTIHDISEELYNKMIDQELKLYALQQPISMVKREAPRVGGNIGKVLRVLGKIPTFFRENVMYNPVSGPAATTRDAFGNSFYTAGMLSYRDGIRVLAKEIPVLFKSYDPEKAIAASTKTRKLAGMIEYSAADIEAFADAGITGGKTPIAQQIGGKVGKTVMGGTDFGERLGKTAGGVMSAKWVRDRRVGIDVISRLNVHDSRLAYHLGDKRIDFLRGAREEFIRMGYKGQDLQEAMKWMTTMGGKNHGEIIFSPDDVFNRLTGIGVDAGKAESMSRTWGKLRREADALAKRDVETAFFSYKQTKVDSALSSVLIFNYWQTRALMNTARVMARNPALIRIGVEMQQYFNETSNMPGLNPWTKGLLNYFSVNLWSFFTDPINAVIPYANFRDWAHEDGQGSAFDKALKTVGLAPWIQFATGALGMGDPYQAPNMFGTTAPMAAAVATADLVRNYVLPEWFEDETHMGLSDQMDLPQRFMNYSMETINDYAVQAGIPMVDTTELQQVGTSKIRQLRAIATQKYMEESGATLETWTVDDEVALADILATEGDDEPHPIMQEAMQEQSLMRAGNRFFQSWIPSGSQMIYEPAAEIKAIKDGDIPATAQEQDAAYDITDVQVSANPEFTGQVKGAEGIGTEESAQHYEMFNDFAYMSGKELMDKYNKDSVLELGGKDYTIYNIARMTKDDRVDFANDWAEENGIDQQIETHKGQVDQYKEDNPAYANYTDWRSERFTVADDVGVDKTVKTMMQISPSYKKYIERLKPADRTKTSIVFSSEAYEAWQGNQSSIYAEHDSNQGGSAAQLADWASMLTKAEENAKKDPNEANDALYKSADDKEEKKKYDDTPEGLLAELNDLDADQQGILSLYDSAITEYEKQYPGSAGDDPYKSTGNDALDSLMGVGNYRPPEDSLNDMKKPAKPGTPKKLNDYYKWRDLMELSDPSADTSVEAYVAWLEEFVPGTWDLTEDEDEE